MTVTIDKIPVFQALVDDGDTGMMRISLVDSPAVLSDFQAFSCRRQPVMYRVEDEEKRLVRGVVMRADFPIYRRDEKWGEYYIIYRADTIRKMAEKYLLESRQNNVNLMHEDGSDVEGVQMVQYFIKDSESGVSPRGFDEIADGSLFAEFHVVNDKVWDEVKAGTYKGFSLEGVFDLVPETDREMVQDIVSKLNGKFNKNRSDMGRIDKIRQAIVAALTEVDDAMADGNPSPATPQQFGNVTTDKGILVWNGDEDLKAGDAVSVEDSDGNRTSAPDGDYRTEDKKIIRVSGGKVSEIVDDEAEVSTEEQKMARIKAAYSASYDEKMRKIADAIAKSGKAFDFYLSEAGDDFAVICCWDADYNPKYFRFAISWNGDDPVVGDSQEVRLAFVPVDQEIVFSSEKQALEEENAALKAEVEELKKSPAAKPAHEEFSSGGNPLVTGNRKLDALAKIAGA